MNKRTICDVHREAQRWHDRFMSGECTPEFTITRLMNIIEEMRYSGARMEERLKEYYDFMSEWMEAADDLMGD